MTPTRSKWKTLKGMLLLLDRIFYIFGKFHPKRGWKQPSIVSECFLLPEHAGGSQFGFDPGNPPAKTLAAVGGLFLQISLEHTRVGFTGVAEDLRWFILFQKIWWTRRFLIWGHLQLKTSFRLKFASAQFGSKAFLMRSNANMSSHG